MCVSTNRACIALTYCKDHFIVGSRVRSPTPLDVVVVVVVGVLRIMLRRSLYEKRVSQLVGQSSVNPYPTDRLFGPSKRTNTKGSS